MKLDEATAVLRPRAPWEAVDLGCALVRRQWGRLMAGWLTVALPLWAVILLLFHESTFWALFAAWWTKPILTRQPVFFLGRALFGKAPGGMEFWREWRTALLRGLFPALTYRRLSFGRSFLLPVIMLEGQSGSGFGKRAAVLNAHGGSQASSLAFAALKLEFVTAVGLVFFVDSFMTEGLRDWIRVGENMEAVIPAWYNWMLTGFYLVSVALIEPFYAGAGFSLYINSRTHLEGWDIEVAFKRLTSRLLPAAAVALLAVCAVLLPARADAAPAKWDPQQASQTVKEVLKDPAFELDIRKIPVRKEPPSSSHSSSSSSSSPDPDAGKRNLFDWPDLSIGGIQGLGYAIIILALATIVFFIVRYWSRLRDGRDGSVPQRTGPRVVMGMDVAPESLPEDIPQAAWRLYESGSHLEALRLLYRGSLSWLIDRAALPVHESDTEGDCLRHTRSLPDQPRAAFFESLTGAWIMCAYAGAPPASSPMRQFCDAYPFSLRQKLNPLPGAAAAAWLVIPLALLAVTGCEQGGTTEYKEETMGYKKEARIQPWLAAEKFLERTGYPTEVRQVLGSLPPAGTALVMPLEGINSQGSVQQMLGWVQSGGHLIVLCSGTDRLRNDWLDQVTTPLEDDAPLLENLGVKSTGDISDRKESLEFEDNTRLHLSLESSPLLDVSAIGPSEPAPRYRSRRHDYDYYGVTRQKPDVIMGDKNSAVLASFEEGGGRITLVASGNPFRNKWIGDADNAAMLQYLVSLHGSASVLIVNASRVNLWQMLVEFAWMPLTAAILLVALWLWRHLPRLGRARAAPEGNLRHFGSQIDEAGMFLERRGTPHQLLLAARNAVTQAAARRGISQQLRDFEEQLSARTGIPAADIVIALHSNEPQNLTHAAATLQKLQQATGEGS